MTSSNRHPLKLFVIITLLKQPVIGKSTHHYILYAYFQKQKTLNMFDIYIPTN